jgi:hypothetical protein
MKLVMTLLVRDEEDIVAANLDYHFAQGVDLAIVTDNRSKDATRKILRRYQRDGRVLLHRERGRDFQAKKWRTQMSKLAADEHADWVITNDADEFWWPREGDLRSTFASFPDDVGAVLAPRTNFAATPEDGQPFHERMTLREIESINPFGKVLKPKVAHRGHPKVRIAQGNHKAKGVPGETIETDALEIFHFPWRSYAQFEAKVVTMGRAYERNTKVGPGRGRVRRWLYELYKEGRLPEYFAQQDAADGLREGLVQDVRFRDFMRSIEAKQPLARRRSG